jgi:hypothetical protein
MGSASSLWAQNQCAGGLVGTATGCGALITVLAVDGTGKATAFTVTTLGNGNPYDGTEDTLFGVQNNSGSALSSMVLTSPDTTFGGIFNFDNDGPCGFGDVCPSVPEVYTKTGYEGPNNTFTGFNSQVIGGVTYGVPPATSGTVTFTSPIPTGGNTWFALEGTPQSLTQISQTQTIQPGGTYVYPVGNDNSKVMPFNNKGGESLTITAVLVPQASFVAPTGFEGESCIPYKDFSGVQKTCVEFHVTCAEGTAPPTNDCDTFLYEIMTNYFLPDDLAATGIGGPDFLYYQNQSCPPPIPPALGSTPQSIFLDYNVMRFDPVTRGGSNPTNGCFVATYTPLATPITIGGTSEFVGFQSPVSNTALNIVKAGSTVPLKWQQLDQHGAPVPNLSLCTAVDPSGKCTAPAVISTPWIFVQAYSVPHGICAGDATVGTDAPLDTTFTGGSGLQNLGGGNYQYNWKTPKGTQAGTCAEITFIYSTGAFLVTPPEFQFK